MPKVFSFFKNPIHSSNRKFSLNSPLRSLAIFSITLVFTLLISYLAPHVETKETSPMPLLRLHVLADTDGAEDQWLKLQVRDDILTYLEPRLKDCSTVEESREAVEKLLPELQAIAEERVTLAGLKYSVKAEVGRYWFPVRQYQDFTAPAGEYEALRVTLGRGYGANWWCVLYPPLCLDDLSSPTEGQAAMAITNEKNSESKIQIRSKVWDWINNEKP